MSKDQLTGGPMPNLELKTSLPPLKKRREWHDYIVLANGLKWGATVTLVSYSLVYYRHDKGIFIASAIVAGFMFLEWCKLAWIDFKRRDK